MKCTFNISVAHSVAARKSEGLVEVGIYCCELWLQGTLINDGDKQTKNKKGYPSKQGMVEYLPACLAPASQSFTSILAPFAPIGSLLSAKATLILLF